MSTGFIQSILNQNRQSEMKLNTYNIKLVTKPLHDRLFGNYQSQCLYYSCYTPTDVTECLINESD